jgi:hypothetical protein
MPLDRRQVVNDTGFRTSVLTDWLSLLNTDLEDVLATTRTLLLPQDATTVTFRDDLMKVMPVRDQPDEATALALAAAFVLGALVGQSWERTREEIVN